MPVQRIVEISPSVSAQEIIVGFAPPPQFANASFDNYIPDTQEPSQRAAVEAARAFGNRIELGGAAKPRGWLSRNKTPEGRPGIYFDGGFGVGKTHLLAAMWNQTTRGTKSFGTFVEYTNVLGLLGFRTAVQYFSNHSLVCIDEFELDDPGDTVLMSTFLGELVKAGVFVAATSNTLPDRLGEGRFAADEFLREIQGLSAHFDVIRIDGSDYRHRDLTFHGDPFASDFVRDQLAATPHSVGASWGELMHHLGKVHPAYYGALVENIELLGITDVTPLRDQVPALRFVALVDRLYDRSVPVINSGVRLDQVFSSEMLKGGYRKKYFRCISRLATLAESGAEVVG